MKGKDLLNVKGDKITSLNLTMESYNRQLIRNTNIYSKMIAAILKNGEKAMSIMSKVPR